MIKISVIIPTVNRHDVIVRAIAHLLDNTTHPYEIIVVDQSRDELTFQALAQLIKAGKITYIKDNGTGISRAKNLGWQRASGKVIAFTDDDAQVDGKWLENIHRGFEKADSNIGVMGGKVIPVYEPANPVWKIHKQWEYLLPAYDQGDIFAYYQGTSLPAGVNYSIYRSVLEQLGGFDENLGSNVGRRVQIYGEDADLSRRLKQRGLTLVYNPDCIVYHPVPLSRQNQKFLNQRLFSEGVTNAVLEIRNDPRQSKCFVKLIAILAKWFYLAPGKQNREEQIYLCGKMLALYKCGVLKQGLESL